MHLWGVQHKAFHLNFIIINMHFGKIWQRKMSILIFNFPCKCRGFWIDKIWTTKMLIIFDKFCVLFLCKIQIDIYGYIVYNNLREVIAEVIWLFTLSVNLYLLSIAPCRSGLIKHRLAFNCCLPSATNKLAAWILNFTLLLIINKEGFFIEELTWAL